MANLIYLMLMSLDGYVADAKGNFDWARPDEEIHTFVNDLARPAGTHLYGRRMYEVMVFWDTVPIHAAPGFIADFAHLWRAANKIVYSSTLTSIPTANTRLERTFEAAAIRQMKATARQDLAIGGPTLAAQAFRAGLIDVCHLFVFPVTVGGGLPAFPRDLHLDFELREERRFGCGVVYLQYRLAASQPA
jgi:dihydrofolate reductase